MSIHHPGMNLGPKLSSLTSLWIRKIIPIFSRIGLRSGAGAAAELERLALLSPHLLEDAGFTKEKAATPGCTVWVRDDWVVTRHTEPHEVSALALRSGHVRA